MTRGPAALVAWRSLTGLMLLAIGRKSGFALFGTTPDAYLGSLAPFVALSLVVGGLDALGGHVALGLRVLLISLISLIAPPVIAEVFCRVWRRTAEWPRYANILNWGQLLMIMAIIVIATLAAAAAHFGVPQTAAVSGGLVVFMVYGIAFQAFAAHGALKLTRWRTALLVCGTLLGTDLLIVAPLLVADPHTVALHP